MDLLLIAVAGAFTVFVGANDGGPLLVTSLRIGSIRPITAAGVLTLAVMAVPALFGTQVATTLTTRLVSLDSPEIRHHLFLSVAGAIVVVLVLVHGGLPTSLTLALVGGIVGVGLGSGQPVAWSWVALILVLAALAPLVGLFAAYVIGSLWGRLRLRTPLGHQARRTHWLGMAGQAFAYGANDGQKALAVFALAIPTAMDDGRVAPPLWLMPVIGALFAAGLVVGVRRYSLRLGAAVPTLGPVHAVSAELSAAAAVTGSAALGTPASMTQVITGALVGSGLKHGVARVRWQYATRIVAAWALTLPLAAAAAALPAAILFRG